jgi:hypothetical protein
LSGGEEFLSKNKGESFDEICAVGALHMVLGCCINRHMFSVVGGICKLKTGLIFKIDEQQIR